MQDSTLTRRVATALKNGADIDATVEEVGDALLLSGTVAAEEDRAAASRIAGAVAPGKQIQNELMISDDTPADLAQRPESLPTMVEGEDGSDSEEIEEADLDPSFTEEPLITDSIEVTEYSEDDVYFPPTDPVVSTEMVNDREVMVGTFEATSMDSIEVDPSAEDGRPGDEALADAIRRELKTDAATAGLDLRVRVREGVAYLSGPVDGPEDTENAEEVAGRVPGVREVVTD